MNVVFARMSLVLSYFFRFIYFDNHAIKKNYRAGNRIVWNCENALTKQSI